MLPSIIAFAAMLLLVFLRLPIAYAMAVVGVGGFAILVGWDPAMALVGQIARDTAQSYALSVVPLFILMGNLVSRAGVTESSRSTEICFSSRLTPGRPV